MFDESSELSARCFFCSRGSRVRASCSVPRLRVRALVSHNESLNSLNSRLFFLLAFGICATCSRSPVRTSASTTSPRHATSKLVSFDTAPRTGCHTTSSPLLRDAKKVLHRPQTGIHPGLTVRSLNSSQDVLNAPVAPCLNLPNYGPNYASPAAYLADENLLHLAIPVGSTLLFPVPH